MKWFFLVLVIAVVGIIAYLISGIVSEPEMVEAPAGVESVEVVEIEETTPPALVEPETAPVEVAEETTEVEVPAADLAEPAPVPMETLDEAELAEMANDVVATVNGEPITRMELVQVIHFNLAMQGIDADQVPEEQRLFLERNALQELIMDNLISQAASQMEVDQADIDAEIAELISQFGTEEEFEAELAAANVEVSEIRDQITNSLRMRTWMEQQFGEGVAVSEEEARQIYEENEEMFNVPETVRASHILLRVPEDSGEELEAERLGELEAIIAQLETGADFAELAEEHSDDPGSAARGGDLNYFPRDRMVPEFAEAAFALEPGQLSEAVRSPFGWHLIKVTDKQEARMLDFDEVKEELTEQLENQQRQMLMGQVMQGMAAQADIEVLDPRLQPQAPSLPPGMMAPPQEMPVE